MKRSLFLNVISSLCIIGFSISSVNSQANNDEYEQWLKQTQDEFKNYLDENDKAFIGFLNKKWESVEVQKTIKRDPEPKPSSIPIAKPITVIEEPESIKETIKPIFIEPIVDPVVTAIPKKENIPNIKKDINSRTAKFDFFGEKISIKYHKDFKKNFRSKISNQSIASYWKQLATQPHKDIIEQLSNTAKELKLNDWGTALLFDQFSREIQGSNQRNQASRQLTSWFLLVKAGFNARVAYNDQIFLLMPSKQKLFSITYFTLDNQRYYSVSLNEKAMKPGNVFTYSGKHLDGTRNLDFSDPNDFIANKQQIKRNLSFVYDNEKFDISISYAKDMVNYFSTFPQLDLENYFSAGMPSETAYSLLTQLKPVIEGHTETEAINRLLRFVQTAFKYKTDGDQFHQENYLFPLETLHYPYSDCEDRAALFAWLAESLLKLDVVIVEFPGHVATAVQFSQPVQGDNWKFNGKRYTIADPTYVNANAGMTMPQYKGKIPRIEAF